MASCYSFPVPVDSAIRPSTPADIPDIQTIARDSWRATYGDLISADSQNEYLSKAYGSEWLTKLHARPDVRGFIATEGDRPVGFSLVSVGTPADDPPGAVLRSFYLRPGYQGKGYGRALLDAVKSAAGAAGAPFLWVAVHTELAGARKWYEQHGFIYDGPAEATIGRQRIPQAVYKMPLTRHSSI